MRASDGSIRWFDFEHCGARNRLDDLVWLLADETVPDDADAEDVLLDVALDRFADGRSADEARAYVHCMGMFHSAVRLGILLAYAEEDGWQTAESSLARDRLPATIEHMSVLARRAGRWAETNEATAPFAPWWQRVERALARLDRTAGKGRAPVPA